MTISELLEELMWLDHETWEKAITKEEVVATYDRLSNEIEKEVIRMAEDLAKDPYTLFLLKTGYQHIVFNPKQCKFKGSVTDTKKLKYSYIVY